MYSKLGQPWIPIDRIKSLLDLEPGLVVLGLCLLSWIIYKTVLRGLNPERHRNMRKHFRNLLFHLSILVPLFTAYFLIEHFEIFAENPAMERLTGYLGLCALFSVMVTFVKVWRIFVFEYLFFSHMKVAVPLLVVNLFTLALSVGLAAWTATEIFNLKLAPLLATSAILSLVLGLALQETLGNLFSGLALQFDKPYEIGHWIEIQNGAQKWTGQVLEISWRATLLAGFGEEAITIPNRIMGQSQISNFTSTNAPIIRSQIFRVPYGTSIERTRTALLDAVLQVDGISKRPPPVVFLTESAESWITVKLIYYVENYGLQFSIADQVIASCLASLKKASIELASPRLSLSSREVTSSS